MLNVSTRPIVNSESIKGNALRINKCLIWFDFGIENELKYDKSLLNDIELPHIILLTNYTKKSIGGLPLLNQILKERRVSHKIPIICTEPVFRFGNNVLLDIIKSMSIRDQERGVQYTCSADNSKPGFLQLPYSSEDVEGILSDNVCRLRYYQSFNIQLFENKEESSATSGNASTSRLKSIVLKALPSGVELGSTIWSVTVNTELGSWEFAYVNETVSHPYWHVTPSDICRLNKPDVLLYGFNIKYGNMNNINYFNTKKFTNRVVHIQKLINMLLYYLKKNKNGTILIPVQLDSLLLELLCYIDAIWSKNNILFPVFIVSPLIKSFMLSVKTLIEWMSLDIRTEFCNSRYNPFHNLKNIYYETNLRNIRNDNILKLPKIIFSFPESLDYGYSRELFTELSSNEDNTVIFLKEPEKDTFAYYIWSKENEFNIKAGSVNTDNLNIASSNEDVSVNNVQNPSFRKVNSNVFEDESCKSYNIELPMVKFIQYRQDELYAMYLSYKDSNEEANGNDVIGEANNEANNHINSSSSINDADNNNICTNTSLELNVIEDKHKNKLENLSDSLSLDKVSDFKTDSEMTRGENRMGDDDSNSENDVLISKNIKDTIEYKKNQSVSSSIQDKIENLRSKLVPVNVDHDITTNITEQNNGSNQTIVNHNQAVSNAGFAGNNNGILNNAYLNIKKDDYGCLLDNNTLYSIIGSWKDASSDVDISSYYNLNSDDIDMIRGDFSNNPHGNIKNNNVNVGNHDHSDAVDNKRVLVPRRRRITIDGEDNREYDNDIKGVYGSNNDGVIIRKSMFGIGNDYNCIDGNKQDFGQFGLVKNERLMDNRNNGIFGTKINNKNSINNNNSGDNSINRRINVGISINGSSNSSNVNIGSNGNNTSVGNNSINEMSNLGGCSNNNINNNSGGCSNSSNSGSSNSSNVGGLIQISSIDSTSSINFNTNNIPEWRMHYRQLIGGNEPYKTTFEKGKLEIRCRVVFICGLELENNISSLLPLLNSSNIKLMVLLSNCRNNIEENILNYYKSLIMSIPNSPDNIVNPNYNDNGLIEFSMGKSMNSVKFDDSIWEDASTGTFQLINDYSSPSAALIESNNNYDSMSNYYALFRLNNLTAKLVNRSQEDMRKDENKAEYDREFVIYRENDSFLSNVSCDQNDDSTNINCNSPYSVLKRIIESTKYKNKRGRSKKFQKEMLLSNSRGLRHIISEFRKQNPIPMINISPNEGIISVNNAVALSSVNNKNVDSIFKNKYQGVGNEDNKCGSKHHFNLKRGDKFENKSNSSVNVWNLHSTLHPYYYIARGILRNQFAIL
ncbi:hypothetical protein RS030_148 [Cryptosporidium xiaoi]|uniref:Cleavage and polyadenylation specificity factor subunit 2 n=1 Tax=Cryptosporidium xiaoi TaxID=659607 RepID=A0AAV9XY81_9CRYT